jgi:hypothetical protein
MTPPIQLERIPKRRKPLKPATVRALFWVVGGVCLGVFAWGVFSKVTA